MFFGFARGFTEIAPGARAGKLLVLRTDLVSFMEAYALQGDLADLKAAGIGIPIVGLNVAQLDTLGALHLIPEAVPENDLFPDFLALKTALPRVLAEIEAVRH